MKTKSIKKTSLLISLLAMTSTLTACGGNSSSGKKPGKTHDPETYKVDGKDTYEPHNFVDGKCKMCDETTTFIQDPLNVANKSILTTESDQKGSVEEITYAYTLADGTTIDKKAYVYLPYGYDKDDASTKYDVLYMLHGKGLNEGYWLAKGSYKPTDAIYTGGFGTENVLDTLMKTGEAKKTICVTPTYYIDDKEGLDGNRFGEELTKTLMPYIASNYHTFATDSTAEALKANRDHQGYVGLSLGSMYSFEYILTDYVDYFSYVGSFSGSSFSSESWNTIANNLNNKFKNQHLKFWYVGVGSSEDNTVYPGDPFTAYRTIVGKVDYFQQGSDIEHGDNCAFMLTNKTGHNYQTWITCLYNCLHVFFK